MASRSVATSERERVEIRAKGSILFSCLAIQCHVLSINRINVYSTATNMNCMDLKEQMGNAPGRSVYTVPVLRSAMAAKRTCHEQCRFLCPVVDCQHRAGLGGWLIA